jgi:hypothetical protein
MQLTPENRNALRAQAASELANGWPRWFVLRQSKRDWLAREVADAIYDEFHEFVGAEYGGSARRKLVLAVQRRVTDRNTDAGYVAAYYAATGDPNGEQYGSIILMIILGAILSWLIGRLLDWLFPAASTLASTPCDTCDCLYGVQPMFQFLSGYKTYLVATVAIVYAVAGAAMGKITPNEAFEVVIVALGFGTLRGGSKTDAQTVVKKLK